MVSRAALFYASGRLVVSLKPDWARVRRYLIRQKQTPSRPQEDPRPQLFCLQRALGEGALSLKASEKEQSVANLRLATGLFDLTPLYLLSPGAPLLPLPITQSLPHSPGLAMAPLISVSLPKPRWVITEGAELQAQALRSQALRPAQERRELITFYHPLLK